MVIVDRSSELRGMVTFLPIHCVIVVQFIVKEDASLLHPV